MVSPNISDPKIAAQRALTLERLSRLPPFRPACLELLAISADSSSANEDFAKVFRADPALAADLLLVANSLEFGSRSRIETISHALVFLGFERIRSLALTIAMQATANQANHPAVKNVWLHSMASAVIAEKLGAIRGISTTYTAALVHDLGRLGLLTTERDRYAGILDMSFESMEESNLLERMMFGLDHCHAGAMLAEKWGFPISLQAAMVAHHGQEKMSPPRAVVRTACEIAESLGFPEVQHRDLEVSDQCCLEAGLSPVQIREDIARHLNSLGQGGQTRTYLNKTAFGPAN